jgi:excisionase family DNA binding protein
MTTETELTISVPEAGRRYFGICRGTSYIMAQRGEIPTIRMGRRVRVPVRTLEAMLDAVRPNSRGDHSGQ